MPNREPRQRGRHITQKKSSILALSAAGEKFNELDNWLGIMDVDPPCSPEEKHAMYERLMEILQDMFEGRRGKVSHFRP